MKKTIDPLLEKGNFVFLKIISEQMKNKERFSKHCYAYVANVILSQKIPQEYDSNVVEFIQYPSIEKNSALSEKEILFKQLELVKKIKDAELRKELFFYFSQKILDTPEIVNIMGKIQTELKIFTLWKQSFQNEEEIKPILKNYFNQPKLTEDDEKKIYIYKINIDLLALKLNTNTSNTIGELNRYMTSYSEKAILKDKQPLFKNINNDIMNISFISDLDRKIFKHIFEQTLQDMNLRQKKSLKMPKENLDKIVKYIELEYNLNDSPNTKNLRNKI